MKKNNEVNTVKAADLAKALKIKSDVRAGSLNGFKPCPTCGIGIPRQDPVA